MSCIEQLLHETSHSESYGTLYITVDTVSRAVISYVSVDLLLHDHCQRGIDCYSLLEIQLHCCVVSGSNGEERGDTPLEHY